MAAKRPMRRTRRRAVRTRAQRLPEKRRRAAAAFVGPAKGNKTKACKDAGYTAKTAEHGQHRVFADPRVQEEIGRLLTEVGLTDRRVVEKHSELLDAKVTKWWQAMNLGDHTDNGTQLDAVRLYYELTGRLTKGGADVAQVAKQLTEQFVQVVEAYVPPEKRAECYRALGAAFASGAG